MPVVSDPQIAGRIDYVRMRATSDAAIHAFGMRAVLRRYQAPDRWCDVMPMRWTPQSLLGRQYDPLNRLILIAAGSLDGEPVMDLDTLVLFEQPLDLNSPVVAEVLKIIEPPAPLNPGGVILQWTLVVRA